MGLKVLSSSRGVRVSKTAEEIKTATITAIRQTTNPETEAVIKWLDQESRFKHIDDVA